MQELGEQVKLYIELELASMHFRYITVHQIANSFGPQKGTSSTNGCMTDCDRVTDD